MGPHYCGVPCGLLWSRRTGSSVRGIPEASHIRPLSLPRSFHLFGVCRSISLRRHGVGTSVRALGRRCPHRHDSWRRRFPYPDWLASDRTASSSTRQFRCGLASRVVRPGRPQKQTQEHDRHSEGQVQERARPPAPGRAPASIRPGGLLHGSRVQTCPDPGSR